MAVSNSVFFPVVDVPDIEAVGLEVTVADWRDYSTYVCDLNGYVALSFSDELTDEGQGSITLSLESPFWDTTLGNGYPARDLLEKTYLIQCWEDGVLRFEFLGGNLSRENHIDSDESREVVLSGPGSAHVLTWGQVFPKAFPNPPSSSIINFDWNFQQQVAMKLWILLLKSSQSRGVIPYVKPNFTPTYDSGGVRWADINHTLIYEVIFGQNLREMLDEFTGQDVSKNAGIRADWHMRPKFQLDVKQNFGVHREGSVIFYDGDVLLKQRDRNRDAIRNYVTIRHDLTGDISISYDNTSIARYQKREHIEVREGLWDVPRRSAITKALQQQLSSEDSSWTVQIPYGRPTRRPFRDFEVGDWIGISTPQDNDWNKIEPYRVMAISIDVSGDDEIQCELTLESLWKSNQRKLAQKIQSIIATPPKGTVKLPYPAPTTKTPVVYDPNAGYIADPSFSGGGGSNSVWVMPTDPATTAKTKDEVNVHDWWLESAEEQ